MKKQLDMNFRIIGDSGPLAVYWYDPPHGPAHDSLGGRGVAWLSPNGELLGTEFDDVLAESDHQHLIAPNGIRIEVTTDKGKVAVKKTTSRKHA
jgi:hypothetical protein